MGNPYEASGRAVKLLRKDLDSLETRVNTRFVKQDDEIKKMLEEILRNQNVLEKKIDELPKQQTIVK